MGLVGYESRAGNSEVPYLTNKSMTEDKQQWYLKSKKVR